MKLESLGKSYYLKEIVTRRPLKPQPILLPPTSYNQVGVIARTNKRNGPRPHGTRAKYVIEKCRCAPCRKANCDAEKMRTRLKAYGQYQPFTEPEVSREMIDIMVSRGLRLKEDIARLTGISWTTIWKIRSGQRKKVTPETERRLIELAGSNASRGGSYVGALGVWETIHEIMACGYSKRWIARKLGYRAPALQFGGYKVRRAVLPRLRVLLAFAKKYPAPNSPEASRAQNYARRYAVKKFLTEDQTLEQGGAIG